MESILAKVFETLLSVPTPVRALLALLQGNIVSSPVKALLFNLVTRVSRVARVPLFNLGAEVRVDPFPVSTPTLFLILLRVTLIATLSPPHVVRTLLVGAPPIM